MEVCVSLDLYTLYIYVTISVFLSLACAFLFGRHFRLGFSVFCFLLFEHSRKFNIISLRFYAWIHIDGSTWLLIQFGWTSIIIWADGNSCTWDGFFLSLFPFVLHDECYASGKQSTIYAASPAGIANINLSKMKHQVISFSVFSLYKYRF